MLCLTATLRRALIIACAFVWLGSSAARAAEPALIADFDGDGLHDWATVDHTEPTLLHIWLSRTGTTTTIRNSSPVVCITAKDLDGDQRAELITRDSATGLHIWTRNRNQFHRFRPRRVCLSTVTRPRRHAVDDGVTGESDGSSWVNASLLALVLSAQPRGPDSSALAFSAGSTSPLRSTVFLACFAPRPPPLASV
jgi:hypothetical protein